MGEIKPILQPGSKLFLLGEAPGEQEEKVGIPFVGHSGQELTRMLFHADIHRHECSFSNLLLTRPPRNDFKAFLRPRAELPSGYDLPPIERGLYLAPEHVHNLERLRDEISQVKPNLVVALGAKALWALCSRTDISKLRGTIFYSERYETKCLATYHPAYILRSWSDRPIAVADLIKARLESSTPEISYPKRKIWLEPALQDLYDFGEHYMAGVRRMAFDLETWPSRRQIRCMAFAPSPHISIVVPFLDMRSKDLHYWKTPGEEAAALAWCKRWLEDPSIEKVAQNGLYDIQYCLDYGIQVRNYTHDTMLLHHALDPEMPKSLDFLGATYVNERAWKTLRPRGEHVKREE